MYKVDFADNVNKFQSECRVFEWIQSDFKWIVLCVKCFCLRENIVENIKSKWVEKSLLRLMQRENGGDEWMPPLRGKMKSSNHHNQPTTV